MRYAVVIEKAGNNYSAYVPDLPGCIAVGDTIEETEAEIRSAIEFHIDGLKEDGLPIPAPQSRAEHVEVATEEKLNAHHRNDRNVAAQCDTAMN